MTLTTSGLAIAIIAIAAIRYNCAAQTPPTDDEIRAILHQRVDARQAPGIVVGLIGAAGQKIIAAGHALPEGGAKVNGDTVFEIGSVTKVFTAVLLADMVHRGEVQLDDPISKCLPPGVKTPKRNGREISLLDLALHRSGLPRLPDNLAPRDQLNPYADYTFENLCAFLSDYTLQRDIGAEYEYSNLGFGLLGSLLARRAGTSYEALVNERILGPLQMTDTAITLPERLKSRLAPPYDSGLAPARTWEFDALAGAGSIRSTAQDLLKFLSANMQLTASDLGPTLRTMQEPRGDTPLPKTRIGLAWHITDQHGLRIVWHNGETAGYHSFIGFDPTNKTGVVVLANSANSIDDIGFHLLDTKRAVARAKAPPAGASVRLAPAQLDRLVGRYQLAPGVFFDLRRQGNRLMAQLTGQPSFEIYPKSETNFFYKVVDAQIDFNDGADGKVQSLTLHQNGADQVAAKISDQPAGERRAIPADAKMFDSYAGEYALAPGAIFTVRRDGDRLLARLTGKDLEIFPENETNFFYKAVDAQITFVKNAGGKTTALVLHQNGIDQRADKTK